MARKDLDKKQDNSNFHANRNPRSFYIVDDDGEDEIIQDENDFIENIPNDNVQTEVDTKQVAKDVEKGLGTAAIGYATKNKALLEKGATNTIDKVKDLSTSEKVKVASHVVSDVKKKAMLIHFLPFLIPIFLLLILIIILIGAVEDSEYNKAPGGLVAMRCSEVTVIMVDKQNNYEITGSQTYSFEDYIAGVVSAEVGLFNNIEVYKEFAIAARSYFLNHDSDCTIESSDRKQVFRDITSKSTDTERLIYQAVEETAGQVILLDGEVYDTEYDAFCSIAVDNNYYTLKQQNQKIPRSWADSQRGINSSWKAGTCAGNHGRGLSQWGSYYLASQMNYDYESLLKYYLGDDITISSAGFMSSIPGLIIKDNSASGELHESLSSFLPSHSSSVEELNSYIRTSVEKNGVGTRAGVVTAAVSLINFLNDGFNVRLPYYWGGFYQANGVNPQFGGITNTIYDSYGRSFSYLGFDCSGFVSWAIKNGGYNMQRLTTSSFDSHFSSDSCDITDSACLGQPGDLINSASCHVQMIVATDEEHGIYYVAESTGSLGLISRVVGMHEGNCGGTTTKVLHMDNYYNNTSNIDYNY